MTNTGTTNLGGNISTQGAAGVDLSGATTVVLTAPVTINTSTGNGVINLNGGAVDGNFALALDSGSGTETLGAMGQGTKLASLAVTNTGTTNLGGNISTQSATGVDLSGASAVVLTGGITVDTSTGGGVLNLGGTLDGTAGTETLGLTAGAGSITFGGAVGGTTTLGAITINSALNVTAAAISAASLTQSAGTGTTTLNGVVTTTGATSITTTTFTNNSTVNATGLTVNAGTLTLGSVNVGAGTITVNTGATPLDIGTLDAGALTAGALSVTSGNMTTASGLAFTGNMTLNSSGAITVTNAVSSTGSLSATATGAITGTAGGIGGSSLTLNGSTVGTAGAGNELLLGTVGTLGGSVTGPATTDVFNVKAGSALTIGTITTNTTAAHDVTIINTPSIGGGGTITASGAVSLVGNPIASSGNALQVKSGGTLTCNGNTCDATSNEFVNASFLQLTNTITNTAGGIIAALLTELSGPSELLSSGILPENIFKSLGSQVLEIVGGAEGFGEGSESGEPVGVKIIEGELESIQKGLDQFAPTTEQGIADKSMVQKLVDEFNDFLDRLFGRKKK